MEREAREMPLYLERPLHLERCRITYIVELPSKDRSTYKQVITLLVAIELTLARTRGLVDNPL